MALGEYGDRQAFFTSAFRQRFDGGLAAFEAARAIFGIERETGKISEAVVEQPGDLALEAD